MVGCASCARSYGWTCADAPRDASSAGTTRHPTCDAAAVTMCRRSPVRVLASPRSRCIAECSPLGALAFKNPPDTTWTGERRLMLWCSVHAPYPWPRERRPTAAVFAPVTGDAVGRVAAQRLRPKRRGSSRAGHREAGSCCAACLGLHRAGARVTLSGAALAAGARQHRARAPRAQSRPDPMWMRTLASP